MSRDRTWAVVSLDNITANYNSFKRLAGAAEVMCVIKANGYGHGAVALGLRLQGCGCGFFGVAALDEAVELCRAGITAPILVLNYVHPERAAEALVYPNIRLTLIDLDSARRLSRTAVEMKTTAKVLSKVKVHIKLDTGMTRVGFNTDAAVAAAVEIHGLPGIAVEGLFTHFAVADETDPAYTELQFERYMRAADEIKAAGVHIPVRHVCNSAATIRFPRMHLDMVRVGISLYGCYPSEEVDKSLVALLPAMQLKTRVIRVNEVGPGVSVSYGRTFTTARQSRLATIPVGYADGVSRLMAGMNVLVNGREAPIAGRVCMDQCVVDVTDAGEVRVGDEVVIFGDGLPVERAAAVMGTINYEVLCMVARRVPRHYMLGGNEEKVVNYLE